MYYHHRKKRYLWLYICVPENVYHHSQVEIVYAEHDKACLRELFKRTNDESIKWKLKMVALKGEYNKVEDPEQAYIREVGE
ncbi:hypothetical protein [Ammoniphilus resinae]|uniref:Nudix hydrolase domain-containing protein n=1 Tax=Ammoniphilus resinae TaxID=861532 RepID=A0ABS4GXK8_9BACL|nr:hypothetical protein [Ammoniphilus resinae]MBP1935014.1 hypothetical protein [Ammoniphilus resinae]